MRTATRPARPAGRTPGGARSHHFRPAPAAPRSRSSVPFRTAPRRDRTPRPPRTLRWRPDRYRRTRTRRAGAHGAQCRPGHHAAAPRPDGRVARFPPAAGLRRPIRIATPRVRTTRVPTPIRRRTGRAVIRTARFRPGHTRPTRIHPTRIHQGRSHRGRIRPAHIRRAPRRVSRRGRSVGRLTRQCRRRRARVAHTRPVRTGAGRRAVRRIHRGRADRSRRLDRRRRPLGRIRNRVRPDRIGRPVARRHHRTASRPRDWSPGGVRRVNPAGRACRCCHRLR
jgi:hypothetical protein